jgi:hypothetical protein
MQPSPIAETSKLLCPSLRFCIVISFIYLELALPPLNFPPW